MNAVVEEAETETAWKGHGSLVAAGGHESMSEGRQVPLGCMLAVTVP